MSRSRKQAVRKRGQYGATVTTLLLYALETGRIDSALLTRWSLEGDPLLARPFLAKTQEEILDGAGSKYTACPSMKLLNQSVNQVQRLAMVGRPCQVIAIRKRMQIEDPTFPREKIALIIGLFCMWSLSYQRLHKYLKIHLKGKRIKKIDIPKGRFLVTCGSKRLEFPHDEIRALSRETCLRCLDFTAELADISVGSTEWKTGWNTLIIRSEPGRELVDGACREGWIEIQPFPEGKRKILRDASRTKKLKVLELLEHEEQEKGIRSYLHIDELEKEKIRNG
jgi:coenzyme F420-reducing hydrogenase beta subunit